MAEFEKQNNSTERAQEYLSPSQVEGFVGSSMRRALALFDNNNPNFNQALEQLTQKALANIDASSITDIQVYGRYLYLPGENNYAINIIKLIADEEVFVEISVSIEDIRARNTEEMAKYQENVLELEVVHASILDVLDKNDAEFWENIGPEDIITDGPLSGFTIVEGVLRFRRLIGDTEKLSMYLNIFPGDNDDLRSTNNKLYSVQEAYLLLAMGVGEKQEELVEVIPKSKEEIDRLINGVVIRKTPEELLLFLRKIHSEINQNDSQTANVENNYKYLVDRLNEQILTKFENEVRIGGNGITPGDYYQKPQILLDFAAIVSGRTGGYDSSLSSSDLDSRLWRPEMATRALSIAMSIQTGEEKTSMNDLMLPNLDIQDEALKGRSPVEIIDGFTNYVKSNVSFTDPDGNIGLPTDKKFKEIITSLGYKEIFDRVLLPESGNYDSLSLEDKIGIGAIARILNSLSQEKRIEMGGPQDNNLQEGETYKYLPGPPLMIEIVSQGGRKIDEQAFFKTVGIASQKSIEHIGSELDRNFDDTWSEIWENSTTLNDENGNGTWHDEADQARAAKFGITDTNSVEYEIFSLYNDIQGNGNLGEVSDSTRDKLKSAGYMLAMVAGAMLLGGGLIFAAARAGIAINSLVAQGTIYGMSGSAVGYGMDAGLGDNRGFYSPTEAITSVGSDFLLGGITGALGGVVANKFGTPGDKFFSRENLPNQYIFAGDITANGILPEMYRLHLMDQIWADSDIFTQNENPVIGEIRKVRTSMLQHVASDEQIEIYLNNPESEDLPEYLKGYTFFHQMFPHMGFHKNRVNIEFDIRFQKAYATWSILNPGANTTPWFADERFRNVVSSREYGLEGAHRKIIEFMELWIQEQENRISEII